MENKYRISVCFRGSKIWRKCLEMGCIWLCHNISRKGYLCDTIWMWNNNSGTSFFVHLTSSRRKRKLNTHQNNHLYGKIGFFFLDFNTDFCHCWKLELHKLLIFYPCKTDYCFIKSITRNEKGIAPLVKWSLRLPYTFLLKKGVKRQSPIL
jgi:hypothetical protein